MPGGEDDIFHAPPVEVVGEARGIEGFGEFIEGGGLFAVAILGELGAGSPTPDEVDEEPVLGFLILRHAVGLGMEGGSGEQQACEEMQEFHGLDSNSEARNAVKILIMRW